MWRQLSYRRFKWPWYLPRPVVGALTMCPTIVCPSSKLMSDSSLACLFLFFPVLGVAIFLEAALRFTGFRGSSESSSKSSLWIDTTSDSSSLESFPRLTRFFGGGRVFDFALLAARVVAGGIATQPKSLSNSHGRGFPLPASFKRNTRSIAVYATNPDSVVASYDCAAIITTMRGLGC